MSDAIRVCGLSQADLRRGLLNLVTQEGTTVFLTTHNLSEAEAICQRVAVIRSGQELAEGHPRQLRAGMSLEESFLAMMEEG